MAMTPDDQQELRRLKNKLCSTWTKADCESAKRLRDRYGVVGWGERDADDDNCPCEAQCRRHGVYGT